MSRADFIALGGIVAVEYTIGLNNDECGGAANCDMNQVMKCTPSARGKTQDLQFVLYF